MTTTDVALRRPPRVFAPWVDAWFDGEARLTALFGPAPSLEALEHVADAVGGRSGWTQLLTPPSAPGAGLPPEDALVVLAGQQPVLMGGPLLVAHKAATAVALARTLEERWERPVVPVFLVANEDHDSSEIDHIDLVDPSGQRLTRRRVPIRPTHECFFRCRWDEVGLEELMRDLEAGAGRPGHLAGLLAGPGPFSSSFRGLLDRAFGSLGLFTVDAHRVSARAGDVLSAALTDPAAYAARLAAGGEALAAAGLPVSFDPSDPRPLVFESADGRRRRLPVDDAAALQRLGRSPEDFSPHAALRPLVQARSLPVVAQVCGPSEILYLGQARGLHALADLPAPVLVPRLEATRVEPGFRGEHLEAGARTPAALQDARSTFLAAARTFAATLRGADRGLEGRVRRWLAAVERGAQRLAEAPAWRGRSGQARLRPRGRYQDMVLAWLPEALRAPDLASWGEHIVGLARPLDAPRHVIHTYPPEPFAPEPADG